MSLRTFISTRVSTFLLDPKRRDRARERAEQARRRTGDPHLVEFFHQVDDPYSHLLAQALVELHRRYEVEVRTWLVPPPDEWAAPERDRLADYALRDARALGQRSGFSFEATAYPSETAVDTAHRRLLSLCSDGGRDPNTLTTRDLAQIVEIGDRLWAGAMAPVDREARTTGDTVSASSALLAGAKRRHELGHYLGATCWYGGEWTWGIDRLGYLEERLHALGASREGTPEYSAPARERSPELIYAQPRSPQPRVDGDSQAPARAESQAPDLHFFLSFRSPYTYIVTSSVIELARVTGAELRLRFVLPMVMRGLPIQKSKRSYILRDAHREAERLGVPFAPIADPVGRPVERGYSLLPWAIEQGRGPAYCQSFMTHVWSRGVDAGRNRGLQRIVEDAGLDWREARRHIDDPAWKSTAEANRQELLDLGLWGVPSFRVGDLAVWGQDRLWRVEQALRASRSEPTSKSAPA